MTVLPTGDDRPAVYTEAGGTVYRVSSLGNCKRALWAAHRGYEAQPYPVSIQAAFDYGHENEQRAIDYLDSQGW
ncbi:MAG: hypothetical protein ACREBW_00675, partial [Candidatus Micrarchaeaceae archaeon]